jgi:hypothetical protein
MKANSWSNKILVFALLTVFFSLITSCSSGTSKKTVKKSDWFTETEDQKKIKKSVTVNDVTIEIDKIVEKKEGVEIWWKATSDIVKKTSPNPNASFAMGFDPAPIVEITGQKGTGMMVYDRFDQLHLTDLDEVKHTPLGKSTYTGYALFRDIGIVDVNKIVIQDAILDLPTEVEFKISLPPNFEGILPLNMASDVRDGKVTLRNLKVSPKETKVSFKTDSNFGAILQLVELTGVTVLGQKYYDFEQSLGDEFQFAPLGSERDYTIKVWKASYRVNGPWEWVIKE